MTPEFWKTKPLEAMTREEWEALCDGCGRCCLHKLRDETDGSIAYTNVACRLLDTETCRCRHYATRRRYVPDCIRLTPSTLPTLDWLPPSCAYRRLQEGQGLPAWHPLVTGDPESIHEAGISVRGRVVSETVAGPLDHHLVEWPSRPAPRPKASGGRKARGGGKASPR